MMGRSKTLLAFPAGGCHEGGQIPGIAPGSDKRPFSAACLQGLNKSTKYRK